MHEKQQDDIGDGLSAATQQYFAGEVEKAIQMLVELERQAQSPAHPGLAFVLLQKAGWLRELGRLDEARSALRGCEAMSKEMVPELLSQLRMEQGIVARRAGDLAEAEVFLKEAQTLAAGSIAEILVMSDILANLASVHKDQGRLEDAQTALVEAIYYSEMTKDPRALASNLNMLGLIYDMTGDRKTARIYLTKSKEIAEAAGMVKELTDATANLAALEDSDEVGLTATLEAYTKSSRLPDIAGVKNSLGITAARQGNFKKSYELLSEAQKIHSDLNLVVDSTKGLLNLAHVALSMGSPQTACDHAKMALEMAEKRQLVELLWFAHYMMAKTQLAAFPRAGASEEEQRAVFRDTMAQYSKAADAIDLLRVGIGRPEERERLLVDKEMVYQEGMLFAGMGGNKASAWRFAERSRGRAFLDSLGASRIAHQAEKHPLAARRSALIKQLHELKDASGPEGQALSDELRFLRSRIIADAPLVAAVTEPELPSIQDVAVAIPPETAIVEFFLGPGNFLTAFVLDRRGVYSMQTLDLGPNDLAGKIQEFRAELQFGVPNEPAGEFLCRLLFGPIWDAIHPAGRLLIVPHGVLHYVPFAALWFKNSGEGPERLYLCQRFLISVLPSTSFFLHVLNMRRPVGYEGNALVLGNPTEDLPSSELEAIAVAKQLKVSPLLGPQAVRGLFLQMSEQYGVVHIASHGVFDEGDPLLSGVLLFDGRLSVEDLLEIQIPAGLLILSGCVTGISAHGPGDELIGLSRAALTAGIPSVITTLWEIDDDAAAVFFERFYVHLLSGMDLDAALGATQRAMLADEMYSSPANWAPYLLLGDCR